MFDLPNTVHQGESRFARPETFIWREPDHRVPVRTCGYCGGLHPEDFAQAEVRGVHMADMKYGWPHKAYLELRNPEPDTLFVLSATSHMRPEDEDTYIRARDLTIEQRAAIFRDRWHSVYEGYRFHTVEWLHAKFYTVHLLEPGLDEVTKRRCFARLGLCIVPGEKPGSVRWHPYDYDLRRP
jgi:hypothetical protein